MPQRFSITQKKAPEDCSARLPLFAFLSTHSARSLHSRSLQMLPLMAVCAAPPAVQRVDEHSAASTRLRCSGGSDEQRQQQARRRTPRFSHALRVPTDARCKALSACAIGSVWRSEWERHSRTASAVAAAIHAVTVVLLCLCSAFLFLLRVPQRVSLVVEFRTCAFRA